MPRLATSLSVCSYFVNVNSCNPHNMLHIKHISAFKHQTTSNPSFKFLPYINYTQYFNKIVWFDVVTMT